MHFALAQLMLFFSPYNWIERSPRLNWSQEAVFWKTSWICSQLAGKGMPGYLRMIGSWVEEKLIDLCVNDPFFKTTGSVFFSSIRIQDDFLTRQNILGVHLMYVGVKSPFLELPTIQTLKK